MTKIPMYTADLIKELEKLYPDTFLTEPTSVESYWKLAGKIELIRYLKAKGGMNKMEEIDAK